jgi:hypothetical protein
MVEMAVTMIKGDRTMTLIIDVAPEVEGRLREEAARRGQDAGEYVSDLLSEMFRERPRPFYETASPEEWVRAFREWAASHKSTAPPIPLEALRRENMYEDRGL